MEAPVPFYRRLSPAAWALVGLIVVGVIVIAATVGDYGISWDEGVQAGYGELVLRYFTSGGIDKGANDYSNLRYYGPGFELLAAALYRSTPDSAYVVRHMLSALAGLLTIPALYRIGRHLGSAWIGVLAAGALLLMPRFYGHAFINSKDIPFACLFAWTMAMLLDFVAAADLRWWRTAALGLAWGLMLCLRPAGLVLVMGVIVLLLAWKWRFGIRPAQPRWLPLLLHLAVAFVAAWILMVLPWPYAHENPLLNPIRAIQAAVRFDYAYPVLFEGAVTLSSELPARYLPEYIAITTPLPVLLLAIIGLVAGIRRIWRQPDASLALILCLIWLVLPIALYFVQRPNVYDGLRHFLFLLPAIAIWYGAGVATIVQAIRPWQWRSAAILAVVVLTLIPVGQLAILHPYQMTYFNSTVGGLAGAAGQYETDYWITSYREAIEWIDQQAAAQPDRTINVLVAGPKHAVLTVEPFRAENVRVFFAKPLPQGSRIPEPFDYFFATTRYGLNQNYPDSPIVHTIGREGAIFTVIRGR